MKTAGYFDYAAATPTDPRVVEVMQPFLTERFGNPSSPHTWGKEMATALNEARASIAKQLGAYKTEIIFTGSSTEAAFVAIMGAARAFPGSHAITSSIEHSAVLEPLKAGFGAGQVRVVGVGASGVMDSASMLQAIDNTTTLVCLQYANNEVGTIQPLSKLAAGLARIRTEREHQGGPPLWLYCDAAQAGLLSLQVSRLGIDLLSMGGSKLYGPPGSGFLYIRTGIRLSPPMPGGGQEGGLRGGTEHVGAAVGLAKALELIQEGRSDEARRLGRLRDQLWQEVSQRITGASLNGSWHHRLPTNLNISIEGCSGEDLVAYLDAAGFGVATGAACVAAHQAPSHVLLALGLKRAKAESSLRLTLGRFSTEDDVAQLAAALETAVQTIRSHAVKG